MKTGRRHPRLTAMRESDLPCCAPIGLGIANLRMPALAKLPSVQAPSLRAFSGDPTNAPCWFRQRALKKSNAPKGSAIASSIVQPIRLQFGLSATSRWFGAANLGRIWALCAGLSRARGLT